jgi:acyl-CoA synthetase (AMP-forming)/AMP-acid ligase II/acyl carrier protein
VEYPVFTDMLDMVDSQARRWPDAIAFEDAGDRKITYGELAGIVRRLAQSLTEYGVRRETRVAVVLPNGPELAVTLLGVCVTAVAAPLNILYVADEFRAYLAKLNAEYLVVLEGADSAAADVARDMGMAVLELSADGRFALTGNVERTAPDAVFSGPSPDHVAAIMMTSGSTGSAKKVPLVHRKLMLSGRESCTTLSLEPGERCLCVLDQCYIAGLATMMSVPMIAGCTVIYTKEFDAAEFYWLLETKQPNWAEMVPTMLHEVLVRAREFPVTAGATSLRRVRVSGMALDEDLMARAETVLGVPILQSYGMTEAGVMISSTRMDPATRKPGSCGLPAGPELRIIDEDGATLPVDTVGEIVVRGENIMLGYEGGAEINDEAFIDGWFRTGDLGLLDTDGHVFLKGRVKHQINRAGEKVNPQEVDDVLMAHPAVAQVGTFPVAHRTIGEDVAAAVTLEAGAEVTQQELRDYARERLAAFKVPQRIVFLSRLPVGRTGKVDRLALAEMAAAWAPPVEPVPAASELEGRIAAVWAAQLGLAEVGPEDNFYSLGGDSLSAVRLFLAVEKALGSPLPDGAMVDITTVRKMVRLIGDAGMEVAPTAAGDTEGELSETEKRSIAVVMNWGGVPVAQPGSAIKVLNPDGRRQPVFWCNNAPGKELAGVAAHLSAEQPFYSLYSGVKLFARTDETVAKLARFSADKIIALQPEGPYYLGGNCHGGRLAVAVAQELARRGHVVNKLMLLEYASPELYGFKGELLLMFGRQSRLKAYRGIEYGKRGWATQFIRPPQVT